MSTRNGCFNKKRKKVRELNIQKHGTLTCEYCGKKELTSVPYRKDSATIDHLVPLSAGGGNQWENLYIVCLTCNHKKNMYADLKCVYFSTVDELRTFLTGIEG